MGKKLKEIEQGSHFTPSVFVLRDVSVRTASSGNPYLACVLADNSGTANAKWWNLPADRITDIHAARFVKVSGTVQTGKYAGEISINSLQIVDEPSDLSDFLPPLPNNYLEQRAKFRAMIQSVRQPYLRQLLERIFEEKTGTWDDFCNAVAAKSMHHAYRGGLLDHSLEVAQLCDATCTVMLNLRRDFLIACALIHDIGKLDEMEHGLSAGAYLPAGNLVGHIVLGMHRVLTVAESIPGFPADLKHGVMHMILSHHGKYEFGSPKLPLCGEAQVLAANDQLSARISQCDAAIASAMDGQNTALVKGWDTHFMHIGDFGLSVAMQEPSVPDVQSAAPFVVSAIIEPPAEPKLREIEPEAPAIQGALPM